MSENRKQMRLNTEEHPLLLSEPSHNTNAVREKIVELMFEKYNVPAVFLAKSGVLSSFAMARQTSLVVDVGHDSTVGKFLTLVSVLHYMGGIGLDEKFFDGKFELVNLVLELTSFVGGDAGGDDGSGDTASTAQCSFGRDKHVRNVLHGAWCDVSEA